MTQDKMRRIVTACVSAATVLLVCLLSFLMYQWITIAVYNNRIGKINREIVALEREIEELESTAASYKDVEWLKLQLDLLKTEQENIKDKN